jgi:predicted DNA-binding transcriptional regulator AlpA
MMPGLRVHTKERNPEMTKMINADDVVGVGEIAERFGQSKNTIGNWRSRYEDFPAPVLVLGMGMAYLWSEVRDWYASHWELPEGAE